MSEYKKEVIKRLQDTELEILKNFSEVCEKYRINYFINYGTLIGAVRHQGFIPWDDDTDVGILQEDYHRLQSIPKGEWEKRGLHICFPEDDNIAHQFVYARLYKNNTKFILDSNKNIIYRNDPGTEYYADGIWLDIFVFHRVKSEKEAISIEKKAFRLSKYYRYSKCRKQLEGKWWTKRYAIDFCQNIFNYLINLIIRKPERFILNKYNALFENATGDYITTYGMPYPAIKSLVKYDDIFPTVEVVFEGITVKAPNNYDAVLTKCYGDYLKLPPAEKRINHPPCVLDFGDGLGNVIE